MATNNQTLISLALKKQHDVFLKCAPAKRIPQGMYIKWSAGIKELQYCISFKISYEQLKTSAATTYEYYSQKAHDDLVNNIMLVKPNSKSSFYIRSDFSILQAPGNPDRFENEYVCYLIGAWDKNGLMRKPYKKVIGKDFKLNQYRKAPFKFIDTIKINHARGAKWLKNGRFTKQALLVGEDANNHCHVVYLSRYQLRKYYIPV